MSKPNDREVRFIKAEFRMETDSAGAPCLVGRAACYNSLSEPMPLVRDDGEDSEEDFREMIMPGAFTRTLAANPDCRLLINHDGLPLARTVSKTLSLSEDPSLGLSCRAALDMANPRVQEMCSALKRGDVDQMSFGFRCMEQSWRRDDSGMLIREIRDAELHDGDVSVVTYPAYKATAAGIGQLNSLSVNSAGRSYLEFRTRESQVVKPRTMSAEHARRLITLTDL